MLEKITLKVEFWLSRWAELVWQPRNAFRRARRRNDLSSFEFFLGNCLAGYLAAVLASVLYFLTFHRQTFTTQVRLQGAGLITWGTALFGIYAVLLLLSILIGGAISYAIYKTLGSNGSFNQHIDGYLELTFLDFIAAFAMTLLILSAPKDYLRGVEYLGGVMWTMLIILVGTRLYYLIVGYWAMHSIHTLTERRSRLAFAIGLVPSYLIINALGLALSWFLAALFVVGGD